MDLLHLGKDEVTNDYHRSKLLGNLSSKYFICNNQKVTIPVRKEYPIGTAKAILEVIAKTDNKSRRDLVKEWNLHL